MKRSADHEVFVNPVLRRPSALRSMLPVLLSSKYDRSGASVMMLHPYNLEGKPEKTG